MAFLNGNKETNDNNFIIKSPKLNGAIVESLLLLLCIKELSITEISFEIQKILPSSSFHKLQKYLVYLVDYELISYSGQRHVFWIGDNGLELLDRINREKKRAMIADSEDMTITIERAQDV